MDRCSCVLLRAPACSCVLLRAIVKVIGVHGVEEEMCTFLAQLHVGARVILKIN